ncbi:organic cation transporter protein-like isoform X2 [Atheta coriaria]|uniref:organic cation transporter protein-like isoform X2 n=1 Tax=Dalotia coriaria TaxID=877792 RepID=UPI0031F3BC9E
MTVANDKNENVSKTDETTDVFQKSMGVFGRWHLWICFIIFLVKFPVAWHQLNIVIIAPAQNFSCIDNVDRCAANCTKHIFDDSIFTDTIISQWDLVCDRAYLANMAQTFTMFGILVGNAFFGFWSDRSGRSKPMIVAVIIQVISGSLCAFVPWLWAFLLLRFVVATATGGTMVTSFVLVMELIGTKWRCTVATLYQIPFNLGHLTLALFGYLFRDWRYSQLAISLPSIILISYFWLLPESPRWLLAAGEVEKATKILETAAKHNNLPVESIAQEVKTYAEKKQNETQARGRAVDLFNTRVMCLRTCCIGFNWIVCGLCFFGVAQYVGQLGGNLFWNIAASAAIQVPGTCISILLLEKLGRKPTLILSNCVAGIFMLLIPFVEEHSHWRVILAVVAMFGISISFPSVYLFSGEVFPTVVRNLGVGITSMMARFGSIAAPHISTLGAYGAAPWVVPVIFGVAPLIGAILVLWLPETRNTKLPDTLEEAANFGKKNKCEALKGVA